jgi:uncharacterized protein (TIGR02145 family)
MSRASLSLTVAALGFLAACGGGDGGTPPSPRAVASVDVTPNSATISPAQSVQLSAIARDAGGNALSGKVLAWSATPASVGTISGTGSVTAIAPGVLTVAATADGVRGEAQVTVVSNSPVATITLSSSTLTLIPQATAQLSALLKDAAGFTLVGRSVTWSASPAATGSVTSSGLVTATAPGQLTITATSEGQSAAISLSVVSGAMVGPSGGTFVLAGGDVEVLVPIGAVASNTMLTVVPTPQPSVAQPSGWTSVGTQYELGPIGTQFSQPVTVKFKFRSTDLPAYAMSGDLKVRQASGNQWSTLENVVVDAISRTVSGRTLSFGSSSASVTAFPDVFEKPAGTSRELAGTLLRAPGPTTGISAQAPAVTLSPGRASVNAQQRSVMFIASIPPNGTGVPLPANTPAPLFRWSTTGRNGALSGTGPTQWTTSTEVQYTATTAVLNQLTGPIDDVKVELLLNPGETDPAKQRIVSATATVDADLDRTYELAPPNPVVEPGQAQNLQLLIRDKQGNQLALPTAQTLVWSTSGVFGNIGTPGPRQEFVVYRANSTFSSPPPRVDDVVVKVTEERRTPTRQFRPGLFGSDGAFDEQTVTRFITVGETRTFVEVKVRYEVTITPSSPVIEPSGLTPLTVNLTPAYTGPGLMYKWINTAAHGVLNVANGVRVETPSVTYTPNGTTVGFDQVRVDVVSVVAGVELETIGSATVSVEVRGCPSAFVDARDGAVYRQVCIGNQIWMAENLRFDAPGSICYAFLAANCVTYGRLYTRAQAMGGAAATTNPSNVRGICAAGWHVPSTAEWLVLINRFGGAANASPALRSSTNFTNPVVPGTNLSGMNILGGGRGSFAGGMQQFYNLPPGMTAFFLSTDPGGGPNSTGGIWLTSDREVRLTGLFLLDANSLRCVKDLAN